MTFTPYATPDELGDWLSSDVPSNAVSLLRSATLLVAKSINESPYDPSLVLTAPRTDATCAQAASWFLAGIDPSAGAAALPAVVSAKSVDGASVNYDTLAAADRVAVLTTLCTDAYDILYAAQLLYAPLPAWQAIPDQGVYVDEIGRLGGVRLPLGGFVGDGWQL